VKKKGEPISFEQSIELRKKLHDDSNRIRLDVCSTKRLTSVAFCEKTVRYYVPARSMEEEKQLIKTETFVRRRIK
jgi:hypothetical protein